MFIFRYDQTEPALRAGQCFAIGCIRQQDLVVDKRRVEFAERKDNLISVLRLSENIARKRLAAEFTPLRNTSPLQ